MIRLFTLLLLPFLSSAHHPITQAPDLRGRQQYPPYDDYTITLSEDSYLSAVEHCASASACSSWLDLGDACLTKYTGNSGYLDCLCTTGYYNASSSCRECSISLGIASSWTLGDGCIHWYNPSGVLSSSHAALTEFDSITEVPEGRNTSKTTSEDLILPPPYTVGTSIALSPTNEAPFGGLMASPSSGNSVGVAVTTKPILNEAVAARAMRLTLMEMVFLGFSCSVIFWTPFSF